MREMAYAVPPRATVEGVSVELGDEAAEARIRQEGERVTVLLPRSIHIRAGRQLGIGMRFDKEI